MKRVSLAVGLAVTASPAFAAKGPFLSLANTDFIVLISFALFIGVLIYFKVPGMVTKMLDDRSAGIAKDIEDARALQEEAKSLLADYERQQRDVQAQADRIVEAAKEEAQRAADQAREDLKASIARRLAAAEDQIAAAEGAAIKEVRDQAVSVAVLAARDVISKQLTAADGNRLIDDAIDMVETKLH